MTITGSLQVSDNILGYVSEEGDVMADEGNTVTMSLYDDRTLEVVVNSAADSIPVDLTGAAIWFTVKQQTSDTDDAAQVQKKNTLAGGDDTQIEIASPATDGMFSVYLVPSDTELVTAGSYMYGIRITLSNNKTYTVVRGQFIFTSSMTEAP